MSEREKEEDEAQKENIKKIANVGLIGRDRYIGTEKIETETTEIENILLEELIRKRKRESRNTIGKYEITPEIGTALQIIFND